MKKILFLIHDLSVGGAEKVLVNLVNNMDQSKFDITVVALFGGGVNEQFLKPHIHYRSVFKKTFRGNSKIMKLFTPNQLHRWFIKEHYDIEVSYLEGPSARVISGCPDKDTKLVSWIHCTMRTKEEISGSFRSFKEALTAYKTFSKVVFVSEMAKASFMTVINDLKGTVVLYNTNDSDFIISQKSEIVETSLFRGEEIKICAVGKIAPVKGFDRLAKIHKRLRDVGLPVHMYILGEGDQKKSIQHYLQENQLLDSFTFLGYQTNPYKYVSRCDLFVCSSYSEGFSTAATEALIVGTPVCTVEVSGMREMLGENNEYGVVCENKDEALYEAIRELVANPERLAYYKAQAEKRGKDFSTENTVKAVEEMLEGL